MSEDVGGMPRSPAEAERQIGRTRAELALTLDALENKLGARHLAEKGVDMFRDTLAGNDGLNRSLDVIRANPIPVAMIGIGAAWLLASNTGIIDRIAEDERVAAARRRVADFGARAGDIASDVAGRVGLGDGAAERPLGYTGNPMVDRPQPAPPEGWMHQALRSARDSGGAMLNRAQGYAGDGVGRIADQVGDAFRRHPLIVGSIAVMAGALLAALLPPSRVEGDLLGDTPAELRAKAEEAGREAVSRVSDAASRAASAATATVKDALDKPSPA